MKVSRKCFPLWLRFVLFNLVSCSSWLYRPVPILLAIDCGGDRGLRTHELRGLDIVKELQGMEMSKRFKALLMNATAIASLAFFYVKGTQPTVVLISAVICLTVLNVALIVSKPKP